MGRGTSGRLPYEGMIRAVRSLKYEVSVSHFKIFTPKYFLFLYEENMFFLSSFLVNITEEIRVIPDINNI